MSRVAFCFGFLVVLFSSVAFSQDKPNFTDEQLNNYIDQQVRTVANRVIDTYGQVEIWKATFVDVFWESYHQHRDRRGDGRAEFERGRQQGARAGATDGEQEVRPRAAAEGKTQAIQEVQKRARFASEAGPGVQPDFQFRSPQINFLGAASPKAGQEVNIRALVGSLPNASIPDRRYDDSPAMTSQRAFDLGASGAYRPEGKFFGSSGGYYAWTEWSNNTAGLYDKNPYENRMDFLQKSEFESKFKQRFAEVLQDKFRSLRNSRDPNAVGQAQQIGQTLGEKYSEAAGNITGYNEAYVEASRNSYIKIFEESYAETFLVEVRRFQNNFYIEIKSASLLYEADLLPGSKIGVSLKELLNLGLKPANDLVVRLSGASIEAAGKSSVSVEASAKILDLDFPVLGEISDQVWPDEVQSVILSIGDTATQFHFEVDWQNVLDNLITTLGKQNLKNKQSLLRNYILWVLSEPKKIHSENLITKLLKTLSENEDLRALIGNDVKASLQKSMDQEELSKSVALNVYRTLDRSHHLSEYFGLYSLSLQNETERDWNLIVRALSSGKSGDKLYDLAQTSVSERLKSVTIDWNFVREIFKRLPSDHPSFKEAQNRAMSDLNLEAKVKKLRDWKQAFELVLLLSPETELYSYLKNQLELNLKDENFDEGMALNVFGLLDSKHEFYQLTVESYEDRIRQNMIEFDEALNLVMKVETNLAVYKLGQAWILSEVEEEWLAAIENWRNVYKKKYEDGSNTLLHDLIEKAKEAKSHGMTEELKRLKDLKSDLLEVRHEGGGYHPFKRKSFRARVEEIGENKK